MARKSRGSSVSQSDSIEKMGEFWNERDFTDFDDLSAPDVDFKIHCAVPVEQDLLTQVEEQAARRGVSIETLVNLWLQEKLTGVEGPCGELRSSTAEELKERLGRPSRDA